MKKEKGYRRTVSLKKNATLIQVMVGGVAMSLNNRFMWSKSG